MALNLPKLRVLGALLLAVALSASSIEARAKKGSIPSRKSSPVSKGKELNSNHIRSIVILAGKPAKHSQRLTRIKNLKHDPTLKDLRSDPTKRRIRSAEARLQRQIDTLSTAQLKTLLESLPTDLSTDTVHVLPKLLDSIGQKRLPAVLEGMRSDHIASVLSNVSPRTLSDILRVSDPSFGANKSPESHLGLKILKCLPRNQRRGVLEDFRFTKLLKVAEALLPDVHEVGTKLALWLGYYASEINRGNEFHWPRNPDMMSPALKEIFVKWLNGLFEKDRRGDTFNHESGPFSNPPNHFGKHPLTVDEGVVTTPGHRKDRYPSADDNRW